MKKLLSMIISLIAVVSICTAFAVPAMAEINVYSPQAETIVHKANDPTVNKKPSNQVSGAQQSAGSDIITFTYSGSGKLLGWNLIDKDGNEIPLSNNAASYRIVSQEGKTLTLEILDWSYFESPDGYTVNAIIEGEGESTTGKKDNSSKAPNTGAASVAFASVAAAGAGAAILALSKKKDAE